MPDVALTPHPALPVCFSSDFLRVYRWLQWCLGVRAGTGGVLSASWCSVLPDWGHWLDQGWWPGNTVSYSQLASLSLSTTYSRVTTSYHTIIIHLPTTYQHPPPSGMWLRDQLCEQEFYTSYEYIWVWYYMQRCSPYDMLMMLYTHIAYVNSRVSPVYLDPRQCWGETITEQRTPLECNDLLYSLWSVESIIYCLKYEILLLQNYQPIQSPRINSFQIEMYFIQWQPQPHILVRFITNQAKFQNEP